MDRDDSTWPHKFTNRYGEAWRARLTANGLTLEGDDINGRRNVPLDVCKQGIHFVTLHLAIVLSDEEITWLRAVLMSGGIG